ncbi:DUF2752 domain-containing protein [Pseudoflavitalea sp. G-6-1-2]|uniref:DUF2752 domain-containing protein n=1 Tax=Pseudoflavitalea sp. G-6-1-2 TaxID=2728841 RepID=UPI00146B711A|nr:DUF2752 domain-containing protein [Pseudoflavitalea sp. G-6-1-2]NML22525.1 DUF2752 domain-containing protein [Pseudoflavitalea sp. G-6-1-2]
MYTWLEKHMFPCFYKQFFGIDCPACGFQRSFLAALKGDFTESFLLYPPLLPVLVLFLLIPLWLISKRIVSKKFLVTYAWSVLAVVMLSYVIKMIALAFHTHSIT